MNPDIVYKVCTHLTLNEIRNFSNINKEYDDMCEYYIKNNIIVKIKHRDEAIKLANEGYKIKYEELNKSIKDVSSLGNVHTLDLSFCTKIKDVSMLSECTNLHTLILWDCHGIVDVSTFRKCPNLHTLELWNCTGIKDVSALSMCQSLRNIELIGCVHLIHSKEELRSMFSNVKLTQTE